MTPSTASFPFPAKVTLPDGNVEQLARLAVAADPGDPTSLGLLRVFVNGNGGVVLGHQARIRTFAQTINPLRPQYPLWTITDDAGGTWTIERGSGCGCGNPLKRFAADRWSPAVV